MKFEQLPVNSLSVNVATLLLNPPLFTSNRYILLKIAKHKWIGVTKESAHVELYYNANAERRVILV
jgi:hypothetical protein